MTKTHPKIIISLSLTEEAIFVDTDIISARVVQEVNPISGELPVNTLTFSIYTTETAYSMFARGEFQDRLSRRMPVMCYEYVNDVPHLIGKFYLDEWRNVSEWEFEFTAVDLIGLLEREIFNGAFYSTATSVNAILADFLPDVLGADYVVDIDIGAKMLTGWIEPGSYRDALRQVLFAAQGAAVTAKTDILQIVRTRYPINDTEFDYLINNTQIIQGREVELLPMVTSVEFTVHTWNASDLAENLFEGEVEAGFYRITFDKPYYGYEVTGVSNSFESGANWINITVTSSGTMVVTGKPYIDSAVVKAFENPFSDEDDKRNDLSVEKAYLIDPAYGSSGVIEDTMTYFLQRHTQRFAVYGEDTLGVALMDMPVVTTLYDTEIRGLIEKITLDLTGGFRADIEVVGIEHILYYIYIGTEDEAYALATEDGIGLIIQR
jgi:hypothetical protein